MKYNVLVTKTLYKEFEIEATNAFDAKCIAAEIILSKKDLFYTFDFFTTEVKVKDTIYEM